MSDLAAKITFFASTALGAALGGSLWLLGAVPWWAVVVGAAAPSLIVGVLGFAFVVLWMASGSH